MLKARLVLILGIWVAILSYLGFPILLKNILFVATGLVLVYFSFVLYKEHKDKNGGDIFDNFSENKDFKNN
ncbi:MAG: hypothetical protein M3P22_02175 [bacterium]|nr:hypothetical protein [bacterium]